MNLFKPIDSRSVMFLFTEDDERMQFSRNAQQRAALGEAFFLMYIYIDMFDVSCDLKWKTHKYSRQGKHQMKDLYRLDVLFCITQYDVRHLLEIQWVRKVFRPL